MFPARKTITVMCIQAVLTVKNITTKHIAQEVKAAMDSVGLRSTDFAGWIMDTDAEGNAVYFLRYEEFGAIYAAKIKQLETRIAELEANA